MDTMNETAVETSAPNVWLSGLLGWGVALAGVLALFGIARLAGVILQVGAPPDWSTPVPLRLTELIFATFVPAVLATALYAVLRIVSPRRAARLFQILALVILLIFFGGPLSLPVGLANKILLALMHIVTAGAIVWALTLRK